MGKKKEISDCWIEDSSSIIREYVLIPNHKMTLGSQINCLTRLLFFSSLLFVLLRIMKPELVVIYFLFGLIIIIMVYTKEKNNKMKKVVENFEIEYQGQQQQQGSVVDCAPHKARISYNCTKPDNNTFVHTNKLIRDNFKENDYRKTDYNSPAYNFNFASKTDNQSLVGCANPKTLVPPIIAPPLASQEDWKNDSSYGYSYINEKKNTYHKESGYEITGAKCSSNMKPPRPYFCAQKKNKPATSYNSLNTTQPAVQPMKPGVAVPSSVVPLPGEEETKESYQMPYEITSKAPLNNTDNLFHKGFKNNAMFHDKYNEDIFTQTITPGTYGTNTRNEPINSLMGVTLAEQNQPPNYEYIEPQEDVNTSNIYDPRFYGYGTSYRGYVDNMVGQPRFYYDDVDAVRMPNYISRNKIDVMPFGDSYGPDNYGGNQYHSDITALADKHYLDSSLQFRTEMQERLMRKVNSNQWQQRMYPINTNGQRMSK